jgi:ABC-type nitrate/sulfonate/bicarbonate transport system permease component
VGLLAGIASGLLLGTWLGASRRAQTLVLPTFVALAQIPTLAWIPLFMLFFGIGEVLKLVVLVKAVVVPVTLHTLVGVRDAQPKLREAAATCACPRTCCSCACCCRPPCPPFSPAYAWPWPPAGRRCWRWSCWPPAKASAT